MCFGFLLRCVGIWGFGVFRLVWVLTGLGLPLVLFVCGFLRSALCLGVGCLCGILGNLGFRLVWVGVTRKFLGFLGFLVVGFCVSGVWFGFVKFSSFDLWFGF